MSYKVTDTGNGVRIHIKTSIIDLSYHGAKNLATIIKNIIERRKETENDKTA